VKGADIQAPEGVTLMVLPADVVAEKQIRIATIMVQNNPFGMAVKEGTDFAGKVLADRNVKVDWISVPDFDAKKFEEAIDNAITAQYDAITLFGVSEALQPAVDRAVNEGLLVYTFNTEPGDNSKRQAYWGQDGYAGGQKIGQALVDQLNGEGEYAIITGSFAVLGHELRRQGARSIFDQNPNMKLVGEFENQDKGEEAYNIVQNLLTSNPNLKGIYVTAGGPFGAAKALKDAGKAPGEIKLVAHDWLDETIAYVREGYITAVLDQDPFNQGYAPVVAAFNKLAAGIDPEQEINWIEGDIATPENVNEKVPQ
jgi:ABC-type sugar transport system substrate-binding protein